MAEQIEKAKKAKAKRAPKPRVEGPRFARALTNDSGRVGITIAPHEDGTFRLRLRKTGADKKALAPIVEKFTTYAEAQERADLLTSAAVGKGWVEGKGRARAAEDLF